jgi:hypothetical protein
VTLRAVVLGVGYFDPSPASAFARGEKLALRRTPSDFNRSLLDKPDGFAFGAGQSGYGEDFADNHK